ncbi:MAG: amphi-Trp domain-containing protein [Thermoleophilia bacterium]
MIKHVYDAHETATRALVARQLHALADELAAGSVDLGNDDTQAATAVVDPLDVTVDLRRNRNHAEFTLKMRWNTTETGAVA